MAASNGYKPEQASDLYISSGTSRDWLYGRHHVFSFTFEMSPDTAGVSRPTRRSRARPGGTATRCSTRSTWPTARIGRSASRSGGAGSSRARAERGVQAGRVCLDRHLDERAEVDHRLEILPAPDRGDPRQDRLTLRLVADDAGGGRQVGSDSPALQVQRQMRIGFEVREPGALAARRQPADVDPTVEVVEDDLDAPRPAAPPACRGDVDGLAVAQRPTDVLVHVVQIRLPWARCSAL